MGKENEEKKKTCNNEINKWEQIMEDRLNRIFLI